jgi:CheY-like chemotaxis protein
MEATKESENPMVRQPDYCNYGRNRKRRKNKCLKIGMNDYIAKPIVKGAIEHTL